MRNHVFRTGSENTQREKVSTTVSNVLDGNSRCSTSMADSFTSPFMPRDSILEEACQRIDQVVADLGAFEVQ